MPDFQALAERYIDTWNDHDPVSRRQRVEQLWAAGGRYIDPLVSAEGHDAIDQTIAAAQEQFPGLAFRLAGPVDAHHQQARFTWELAPDGAEAPVVGFDVAVADDSDRLTAVYGFLDKVPQG